jgi:hypothetical protein
VVAFGVVIVVMVYVWAGVMIMRGWVFFLLALG